MNMSESIKELLTSADIKSEDKISIKHEPIESTDFEDTLYCSTEVNRCQNIAPVTTENDAHKNLIENDDQKMKIGLNVFKVKIEDVDLHLNLKADADNFNINLDKKLQCSIRESKYPKVLMTRKDIDTIKNYEISVLSSLVAGNLSRNRNEKSSEERKETEGITDGKIKKKLKCSLCNYETVLRGNLERHLLIHSNVKLLKCSKCNYSCHQKISLKHHLLKRQSKIIQMFGV